MAGRQVEKFFEILQDTFPKPKWTTETRDPFKTLIMTIISQNTNERNTIRAFENLSNKFRITPETLAKAEIKEIEESLKTAGLYRRKSRVIKHVSEMIYEKHANDLAHILSLPLEQARTELFQLPGVGPKTADVVLLFAAKKPTMPVDTHVRRVSKRLGLAPEAGNYEDIRINLQHLFEPEDYFAVHILLIQLGREYCRARTPLCFKCPLNSLCPSRNLFKQRQVSRDGALL
jgi:endonuclease-3